MKEKPLFFARKFDPLFNQHLINAADQAINGLYTANFKSLNAFWLNVYSRDDATVQPQRHALLFHTFFRSSVRTFAHRLEMAVSHYSSEHAGLFSLLADMQTTGRFDEHVEKIEALFTENRFKGYLVSVVAASSSTGLDLAFEVLFRRRTSKELIGTFEIANRLLEDLISTRESILNSLVTMEVSTDYEQKERRFGNYAWVMDDRSNPTLLMEFDPIDRPIEFHILWVDKNSELDCLLSLDLSKK